jgi:hypothetical protein
MATAATRNRLGSATPPTIERARRAAARPSPHVIAIGPGAPALAREAVAQVPGLPDSIVRHHAQMLVSELVSHRMRGPAESQPSCVVLEGSVDGERLRVQLCEADAEGALALPRRAGLPLAWEIQLVAQLADRWGVRNDGLSLVWFELEI